MKLTIAVMISAFLSHGTCLGQFEHISGELLDTWNDIAMQHHFPNVYYYPLQDLSDDGSIYEIRFGGIEAGYDSLNLYLIALSGDIPFLLASGGYRGEYNFAKSSALFDEESGLISLYFQMPGSARFACSEYYWDMDSKALTEIDHYTGDPSLDALEMIDILLELGEIEEAERVLMEMFYPGNYYQPEEMFCLFLRAIDSAAMSAFDEGNRERAVELFTIADGIYAPGTVWYAAFRDDEQFSDSPYSEYIDWLEYRAIIADFLEVSKELDD